MCSSLGLIRLFLAAIIRSKFDCVHLNCIMVYLAYIYR